MPDLPTSTLFLNISFPAQNLLLMPTQIKYIFHKYLHVLVSSHTSPHRCCVLSRSVVSDSCNPLKNSLPSPPSMGFPRQECWIGWPLPSPEVLPNPGIEPESLASPALQAGSLQLSHQGSLPFFSPLYINSQTVLPAILIVQTFLTPSFAFAHAVSTNLNVLIQQAFLQKHCCCSRSMANITFSRWRTRFPCHICFSSYLVFHTSIYFKNIYLSLHCTVYLLIYLSFHVLFIYFILPLYKYVKKMCQNVYQKNPTKAFYQFCCWYFCV